MTRPGASFRFLTFLLALHSVVSLASPTTRLSRVPLTALHASTPTTDGGELKDYSGEASSLFGNVRIPSALFAGASAAAAFAMPLGHSEGLKIGLVKRLYALLMMGALSSQIVAVVISTLTVGSLATCPVKKTSSVSQLLKEEFALEWIGARWHFLTGVLMFVVGVGMRAWITIACPVVAKAALGIIISSTLLCVAFLDDLQQHEVTEGLLHLPWNYLRVLWARAVAKPLFGVAFLASILANGYILWKMPHIIQYLMKS